MYSFNLHQCFFFRFNRAALINIGYIKTKDECDYLVMHDVDLLPNNPDLLYHFPEKVKSLNNYNFSLFSSKA